MCLKFNLTLEPVLIPSLELEYQYTFTLKVWSKGYGKTFDNESGS